MSYVDGLALTARTRFGATPAPSNTFVVPSGSSWMEGGLCCVVQMAVNDDGAIPANVIPAGWTSMITSVTGQTAPAGSYGVRMSGYYKIMTAADLGTTITCMQADGYNRICGTLFGFNRPVRSVTVVDTDQSYGAAGAVPATLHAIWDSVRTGAHLAWGGAIADVNVPDYPPTGYNWEPDSVGSPYEVPYSKGTITPTRTYYTFYPKGVDPDADTGMAMSDMGGFNGVASLLFRLF